ncbi:SinI family restriction endonuclease [Eggerthellaceae bacterium zg-1084]|uniref:SinI family restriction endonuclease n=1 Tax=Berryella wangjianweii TaxID=2734634 RepID=UPI0015567848|nr:SinI family restriction endonuclease [Berryella wangjianweii]NPD30431.1 SinI family restriction endonuclease [Berryella wangjianweii]
MARLEYADKSEVLARLDESIRYCNSHRDNVQDIFDHQVEERINKSSRPDDYEVRSMEMRSLFPVITDPDTSGFIPTIKIKQFEMSLGHHDFVELWLSKWIDKFLKAWESLPSERQAKPKSAVTDYALITMVASHAGSEDKAREWARIHNLFMSAENNGGNLLEEYIASKVAPFGWIWCRGQILTAVDLCNESCTSFVQIKNKWNTENSSGKGFRESRRAPVWYRISSSKSRAAATMCWPELVEIIRAGSSENSMPVPDDLLTEEDYLSFIRRVSQANMRLITGEEL